MRGHAGPIIIGRIRKILAELLRAELEARKPATKSPPASPEIAVRFVVGAYLSVVTWWLDRCAKEPPEEIDRAFRELALDGLGALLRG